MLNGLCSCLWLLSSSICSIGCRRQHSSWSCVVEASEAGPGSAIKNRTMMHFHDMTDLVQIKFHVHKGTASSTGPTGTDLLPLVGIWRLGRWELWGGQSIGNCLWGGCWQKPQWVVGIEGGAIEDADCPTFLAPAVPWLLYVAPCLPDIHRLLPASPHTPPGLRHPHKAQQAAPSHAVIHVHYKLRMC